MRYVGRVSEQSTYSAKLVFGLLGIFLGVILMLKVAEWAIFAVGALMVYTLTQKRVEYTFFVLVLFSALSVVNPVIVKKGFAFYLITRGALFTLALAMTTRSGFQKTMWFMSPFYLLFGYVLYMMATSLSGWAPIVSELKAVLFLVFMSALVQTVSVVSLSGVDSRKIRAVMAAVSVFYLVGSVAVIPFPSIGQSMMMSLMEGTAGSELSGLYNGLTWHSQTLGPLVAMLNAFIFSDFLCNFKKKDYLYSVLLISAPILVYKSSSRTAFFGYMISILATLFFFNRDRNAKRSRKANVLMAGLFVGAIAILVIAIHPGASQNLEAFLRKTQDVDVMAARGTLTEDLAQSRMGQVEIGMANFRKSPVIGNGFQVSEEMQFMDKSETGFVLSAPIEKGVLPVMVLEEGGVVGAAIFAMFIFAIYWKYSQLRFTCFLSTFTVFIALNSGEASFFSTSGSGGILWLICFSALLLDLDRLRLLKAERQGIQSQEAFLRRYKV